MLPGMRISVLMLLVALTSLFAARETQAQRRGQRPDRAGRTAPARQPVTPSQPAVPSDRLAPGQTRFKDLGVDSTFFFLSDTNRAYPWKKISDTTARNTVNTNEAAISGQTPVIKQQ
jgi:hypothetical protein